MKLGEEHSCLQKFPLHKTFNERKPSYGINTSNKLLWFLSEINFVLLNIVCCIRNRSKYEEFDVSSISNEIEIKISIKMFQGLLHINMLDGIEIKNLLMARTCKFKYTYDFEEA